MSPVDRRLLDALMRNDFLTFAQKVFGELNFGRTFQRAWFHETIAYFISVAAIWQEHGRVVINLPPRSLKSTLVSVALPAFLLGRDPTRRIIVVSYNQDLAALFGRQTRQVMQADWYKRLFPSTQIPKRAGEMQFYTSGGGFRKATSIEGTLTGRGGDLIILDDPQKASDAHSETQRNALANWAKETLFTRLDDKLKGAIMLVQQRLHEDDLSGMLMRSGDWLDLSLPAIAVKDERLVLTRDPPRYHDRRIGDLLDPVREPREVLDGLKQQMGTAAFLAQYQQDPVPPDGDIVKVGWFRTFDEAPEGGELILSVDTASKAGERNDWSAALLWRVIENRYYLEYAWRRRVEFPELVHSIIALARSASPDKILIEDKGSGIGLLQTLRDHPEGFPAIPYDPGAMDKETRMRVQSAKIEGGQVFLPDQAPWLEGFFDEVRRFPNGRHDDKIDAMSQFLDYVSRRPAKLIVIR